MKPFSAAQDRQRQLLSNYYSREKAKIQEQLYAWQIKMQKEHAGDDSWNIYEAPEYQEFKNKMYALEDAESKDTYEMSRVQDAQNRKIYDTIQQNVHSGTYNPTTFNVDYDDTVKNQNWYKILNGVKAARRGGILRPSTQYLLNKVIK